MINANAERKAATLIEALTRTCEDLLTISEEIFRAEETHEVSWAELDAAIQRNHRLMVIKCAIRALSDITYEVPLRGEPMFDPEAVKDDDFIF